MKTRIIIVIMSLIISGCETMDSFTTGLNHGTAYGINPTSYDRYMDNYYKQAQLDEYIRQNELNRQQAHRQWLADTYYSRP